MSKTVTGYYDSAGIFFNPGDAQAFITALEAKKLPFKVEILKDDEDPEALFGVEVFVKKSVAHIADRIKEDMIRATLENKDYYLHQIPDNQLLEIPLHPEDVNDFDYWAALELIRQKGLPLENRDWETYREQKMLEIMETKEKKSSGLFGLGIASLIIGVVVLIVFYKTMPYLSLIFFVPPYLIGKYMKTCKGELPEKECTQGRWLMWTTVLFTLAAFYFTYVWMEQA